MARLKYYNNATGMWEYADSDRGFSNIEVLDADPSGSDLYEGRIWLLRTRIVGAYVTAPVISLAGKTENSITINLNNASYDETGTIVDTYNVYLNDTLAEAVTLAPGGSYTLSGLTAGTAHTIKVCGVSGEVESPASNVLSVTTESEDTGGDIPENQETIELTDVIIADGSIGLSTVTGTANIGDTGRLTANHSRTDRKCVVCSTGVATIDNSSYYAIPVDPDVVGVTVECDGLMFGFNGWTIADDQYTYVLDSGWKGSGASYSFAAGACQYATIGFKSATSASITDYDTENIKVFVIKRGG